MKVKRDVRETVRVEVPGGEAKSEGMKVEKTTSRNWRDDTLEGTQSRKSINSLAPPTKIAQVEERKVCLVPAISEWRKKQHISNICTSFLELHHESMKYVDNIATLDFAGLSLSDIEWRDRIKRGIESGKIGGENSEEVARNITPEIAKDIPAPDGKRRRAPSKR